MNTVQNIECVTDLSLLVNTSLVDVVADKIRQNIYTGKFSCLVFCETVFFDGVADLLHHFIIKIQIMQGT